MKPLKREALNTSVLLCLRDDRHLRFNDSLLGMMETVRTYVIHLLGTYVTILCN